MHYLKFFLGSGLFMVLNFGLSQSDPVIVEDTTVYAYNLVDDTSSTENGLVDQFDVQFLVDSIASDPDSLFFGHVQVSFDLKSVVDFGKVQVEFSKYIDGVPMVLLENRLSAAELTDSGALIADHVEIVFGDTYQPGTYYISMLVFTADDSALRVLTKTIIL